MQRSSAHATRRSRTLALVGVALVCPAWGGCHGEIGEPGPSGPDAMLTAGATGLHRLTRLEYDATLRDLLGDTTRSGFARLPEDVSDPFDNDFRTQLVSGTLIGSAESLAQEAAARALADPARRDALVGCTPSGPGDQACFDGFVQRFGRLAFRRPLTADEVQGYRTLLAFGVEDGNFYTAIDLVLRAMLQDPSFLYRVEIGQPVQGRPGLFRLNDHEIGARLSYFLWGSTPSAELLDRADTGQLVSPEGRRDAAAVLLADARGRQRIQTFHAFWLGYDQLPLAADLANDLRAESDALVQRVIFDPPQGAQRDYFQIFRADETFLTAALATHYGLPAPAGSAPAFVGYGSSPRRGILSHGTVLSAGAKFDDTSPTLRGVFVRNRLLCEVINPPPPNVAVDEPPAEVSSPCKFDRYAAHRSGGCSACHNLTDPIGFGLENYDRAGRYRATDKDNASCAISGDGFIDGVGAFNGPAELAELLITTGGMESCVTRQMFRFAMGRREETADDPSLRALTEAFKQRGRAFDELVLDLVATPAFGYRQVEE